MNHRIETARLALANISGGSATYVATATSAAGLSEQLNQTHMFLYLNLPIWIFFTAAFLLAIVGSLGSLYIDVMREDDLTLAQKFINLSLGFITGLLGAFVVLPAFTAAPPMPVILLTSLITSFAGTVVIRNIGDLIRNEELWDAVKTLVIERLKLLSIDRLKELLTLFFGGRK